MCLAANAAATCTRGHQARARPWGAQERRGRCILWRSTSEAAWAGACLPAVAAQGRQREQLVGDQRACGRAGHVRIKSLSPGGERALRGGRGRAAPTTVAAEPSRNARSSGPSSRTIRCRSALKSSSGIDSGSRARLTTAYAWCSQGMRPPLESSRPASVLTSGLRRGPAAALAAPREASASEPRMTRGACRQRARARARSGSARAPSSRPCAPRAA